MLEQITTPIELPRRVRKGGHNDAVNTLLANHNPFRDFGHYTSSYIFLASNGGLTMVHEGIKEIVLTQIEKPPGEVSRLVTLRFPICTLGYGVVFGGVIPLSMTVKESLIRSPDYYKKADSGIYTLFYPRRGY